MWCYQPPVCCTPCVPVCPVYSTEPCFNYEGHVFYRHPDNFYRAYPPAGVKRVNEAPKQQAPVVVVVGGGLAGLCAAVEAANAGARVILIEKEKSTGGNSAKASSGMNAAPTPAQKEEDSTEAFFNDTIASGGDLVKQDLARVLVDESADAWAFLTKHGVDLSVTSKCGGHSVARTHRNAAGDKPVNVGWAIMSQMKKAAGDLEKVEFKYNTRVTGLVRDSAGAVVGVKTTVTGEDGSETEEEVTGTAVVLTTGGYSSSKALMEQHFPEGRDLPTTNGPWATGDGIALAADVGAASANLDKVQVHPTAFVDPAAPDSPTVFLCPEAVRAHGGLLFNHTGQRFVDELQTRDVISAAIQENCDKDDAGRAVAYLIMNQTAVDAFGEKTFGFYYNVKHFFEKFEDAHACSKGHGWDYKTFLSALKGYGKACKGTNKDPFGKTTFPCEVKFDQPMYIAKVTPAIHYTMGGVNVDSKARVVDGSDVPIVGLYAAGEVTNGVHGKNRLAGNSLAECVVFGRIAGRSAAETQQ